MKTKLLFFALFVILSSHIFGQSISLTFPNGGQHFTAGVEAPHNIIWTDNGISYFNVYFSVDSGLTWTNIATNITDNFLSWAPPANYSSNCLIRVTDNTETYSDTSNSVFSIVQLHNYFAEWNTNHGTFRAMLHNELVPITTQNFMNLAERNFYNNLIFHRVIEGFMIQDGDPNGNGTGGPGYEFDNEITPLLTHDNPGVLAMANAGPNTNGSQYYITVAPTAWLDGSYSIFGRIIDNMDVVYEISEVPTDGNDKPLDDVIIYSVTINEATPQLSLNFPQGGQSLIENYNVQISWNSDYIPDVKIEFSSDNGSNWNTIIDSIPADEEIFNWNVPSIYSTECIIKITDINNDAVVAQSAPFEIRVKPVKVTRIEFFEGVDANADNSQNFIKLGKPLRFKVQLFNDFSENLNNVGVKLTTSDTSATITNDTLSVNSISQDAEIWSSEYFEIILPETYPTSGNIPLQISVNASNVTDTAWITDISIPMLKLFNFLTIDDDNNPDSQGNGNQILQPGETIELWPKISNSSPDTCYQSYAKLTSSANFINVWNNVQGINRIVFDTTVINNFQPMLPHSSANEPQNDFVFDYTANSTYFVPLTVEVYGYLNENQGDDWQHGGIKAAWGIDLNLNSSYPVDIEDIISTNNLKILETSDKIKFELTVRTNNSDFQALIYDLSGKIIYSETVKYNQQNIYQLNNSKLNTGIYLINLKSNRLNISDKFLIK